MKNANRTNLLTLTAQELLLCGRSLPLPFAIKIDDSLNVLKCQRILRFLPKKRLVMLCSWQDRTVVAKLFFGRSASAHQQRELDGIKALKDSNITTPKLIAATTLEGELCSVITEYHHNDIDRKTIWALSENKKFLLLQQIISTLAQQHAAGLAQKDLHVNNFIFSQDKIFSVDANSLAIEHVGQPLEKTTALKNVALFFTQFPLSELCLTHALYKTYCEARQWPFEQEDLDKIQVWQERYRADREKNYLAKATRSSSEFMHELTQHYSLCCRREIAHQEFSTLVSNIDNYVESGRPLKKGRTSTVTQSTLDQQSIVIKRYNDKGFLYRLKHLVKPTRARRCWLNAHRLMHYGVLTPKPLAMIEKKHLFKPAAAYYISEHIEGVTAREYFDGVDIPDKNQKIVARNLVKIIEQLTELCLSHGDLKATNFLIKGKQVYLTDLDSMKKYKSPLAFKKAQQKDQDRFLKNWDFSPELKNYFNLLVSDGNT